MTLLALALLACGGPKPVERSFVRPEGTSYPLARHVDQAVVLQVSPSNRPARAPEALPPPGSWRQVAKADGVLTWEAPLPYRLEFGPRGERAPGLDLLDPDGRVVGFSTTGAPGTWSGEGTAMRLRLPGEAPPDGFRAMHPTSRDREDALNLTWSGQEPLEFVARTVTEGNASRTGLYLPAPSVASWDLVVPSDAKLTTDARLVASRLLDGQRSDGATVVFEVEDEAGLHEVSRVALRPGSWEGIDLDLSAWSEQPVRLTLRSEPGDDGVLDYVFLGEPTVYTPLAEPRRVVVAMADTLRADHLGLYGYDRDTSPWLDGWAAGATVYTSARSVAPWTLPSMRAALSGRYPDEQGGLSLVERLSEAGWVTIAFVDNAYMGAQFGMAEGWSWHHLAIGKSSARLAKNAAVALEKTADRDVFVLVQTMDTHLPYDEPEPFRHIWAGEPPPELPAEPWVRPDIVPLAALPPARREAVAQHLVDRYDQSVRVVDHAMRRLLGTFDEDDVAAFFGDHGEEFLEHGGFEHGHSVFDELVAVPLIIKAPGLPPGRIDTPVSLLDLAPTLLDLAGVDHSGLRGTSLVGAPPGDRSLGMGFTLHGSDAWAVLQGTRKWVLSEGEGKLYDLDADPREQAPAAVAGQWPERLSAAMDRPVVPVWRVTPGTTRPSALRLAASGGIDAAWMGLESPDLAPAVLRVEAGVVEVHPGGSGAWPVEIFARLHDPRDALEVSVERAGQWTAETVSWPEDGAAGVLVGGLLVGPALAPMPSDSALWGELPDGVEALRALGYVE